MDTDLPDFLGGESAPEPQAAPAPAPVPDTVDAAPDTGGPARGPDGKFAAAEPAPQPTEAPPAPTEPVAHHVPLTTFLDVRDKLSAAEKEARELREWRAQQEAARQRPAVPDRSADPEGYEAYREAQSRQSFETLELVQRRELSRIRAEVDHGKDVVNTAFEWATKRIDEALSRNEPSPLNDRILRDPDPIGYVVSEWKREQTLSQVSDPAEFQAFLAWKAQQAGAPAPGAPTTQAAPPPRPTAPRPSLAASPSAGAHAAAIPRDGEEQFGAMFGS